MKLSRRKFLKIGLAAVTLPPLVGTGYGAWEARSLRVDRRQIVLARLPRALAGMKVALVTDIHHGPLLSLERVRGMVELVNSLKPDLICLGGDYVEVGRQYMRPCIAELGKLSAPMGVYGVLGNHDHWEDPDLASQLFREVRIKELTNSRVALVRDGSRIWLCGVDDLWSGKPDVHAACDGIPDNELCIVLSHNPDLAEHLDGVRVDLLLSGTRMGAKSTCRWSARP